MQLKRVVQTIRTKHCLHLFLDFGCESHGAAGNHCGDCMLVNHLCDGVSKQNYVLVKRLDVTLQFNAIYQVNGYRYMFLPEKVEEWVL